MKKMIAVIWCCLFLLATESHASWQRNWVIGASAGYARTKQIMVIEMTYPGIPLFPPTGIFQERSDLTAVAGFLAGSQLRCQGWVIGGEVNLEWENRGKEYQFAFSDLVGFIGWTGIEHYNRMPTLGVTGRIGYEMAPYFIPYMRLGLETKQNDLNVTFIGNDIFPFSVTVKNDDWKGLFVGGFGAEIPLPIISCPAIRIEYSYRCYLRDSGVSANNAIAHLINPSFDVHTHPRTHKGLVSLVWAF